MALATAEDLPALLPDDVLAGVLRRLAPRHLAVSRSVCKVWRAVVDARGLLDTAPLPVSLAGILINFHGCGFDLTELFSRPSSPSAAAPSVVNGKRNYLPQDEAAASRPRWDRRHELSWSTVADHCNGLLLLLYPRHVLNPATGRVAPLPPEPPSQLKKTNEYQDSYLAYDPAVSPHYEVISIPRFRHRCHIDKDEIIDPVVEHSEWPPLQCTLHVFSSRKGAWEERSFVREGDAAGTIADMRLDWPGDQYNTVYLGGALYVHCQNNIVLRISLLCDDDDDSKCQVIKLPPVVRGRSYPELYIGKSEKGVYCASIDEQWKLQVWILSESCGKMEWVLRHDRGLVKHGNDEDDARGPWFLQDVNYHYDRLEQLERIKQRISEEEDNLESYHSMLDAYNEAEDIDEVEFEWNSEASTNEDQSSCNEDTDATRYCYIDILGFHPYKEIIFLSDSIQRGLAYHMGSFKVEDLGNIYPKDYNRQLANERFIVSSFPYTPCMLGVTVREKNELEGHLKE